MANQTLLSTRHPLRQQGQRLRRSGRWYPRLEPVWYPHRQDLHGKDVGELPVRWRRQNGYRWRDAAVLRDTGGRRKFGQEPAISLGRRLQPLAFLVPSLQYMLSSSRAPSEYVRTV